jgi:hypothetical protein
MVLYPAWRWLCKSKHVAVIYTPIHSCVWLNFYILYYIHTYNKQVSNLYTTGWILSNKKLAEKYYWWHNEYEMWYTSQVKNLLSQQIWITKNSRAGEKQVSSVYILGQSYKHISDLIAFYPTTSPQSLLRYITRQAFLFHVYTYVHTYIRLTKL